MSVRLDGVEVMIQQWRVDGVDAMSCLLDAVEAAVRESARVCSPATPSPRRPLECFVHTQDWDCALGDEIDDGGDPPRIWFVFGVLFL
jgi:hypothetical protein